LTFNAGSFESARAGLADYAQPGESCEQLRARINRLVLEDLERSVRAMRELHERLGDTAIRTSSPGPRAGAPSGAPATPPSSPSSPAPLPSEGASSALRGPGAGPTSLPQLLLEIERETHDANLRRARNKRAALQECLALRGRASLRECGPADEYALRRLLGVFESVNEWADDAPLGTPAPRFTEKDAVAA
jgi:hypothetical protein